MPGSPPTASSIPACSPRGHDLRAIVRGNASDDALDDAIAGIWRGRTDRYSELRTAETAAGLKVEMSYIGG